jgi:hypothetical protein
MNDDETEQDCNGGLFVTDNQLVERLGVPKRHAKAAIQMLDATRGSGFPPKQKLWGDRRYWPAVKAYFDKAGGLS